VFDVTGDDVCGHDVGDAPIDDVATIAAQRSTPWDLARMTSEPDPDFGQSVRLIEMRFTDR